LYLRATAYVTQLITAAPVQAAPTVETAAEAPACGTDTDGLYTLNFTYTAPANGAMPIGFRVQEGTSSDALFEDAADEPLVGGANSRWSGSPQWTSSANPDSGDPAYFIADGADQNEVLTMIDAVTLPDGASLSFDTFQETEEGFDYAVVELIADGALVELGVFTGAFAGTRTFDLTPYGGMDVKVQFRMTSDQLVPAPGWWISNIRIDGDDFTTLGEPAAAATSFVVPARADGTRFYRIAALFADPVGTLAGPYSNVECVSVEIPNLPPIANAGADFDVDEGLAAMLSGSGSSDPENRALTYAWSQTGGPVVTLTEADTATPSFTAPQVGLDTPLTFELRVTDDGGNASTDDIVVTVLDIGGGPEPETLPEIGNNQAGGLPRATLALLVLLALGRRGMGSLRRQR
jgi:hypothetical protein